MRSRLLHVLYVDAMPFHSIFNLKLISDLLEQEIISSWQIFNKSSSVLHQHFTDNLWLQFSDIKIEMFSSVTTELKHQSILNFKCHVRKLSVSLKFHSVDNPRHVVNGGLGKLFMLNLVVARLN